MQLFYLTNPNKEITLNSHESKHAIKVLRKKERDILNFTDGKGGFYKAEIITPNAKECKLKIISSAKKSKQHNYYLHIAIAPTKNINRFEWFLEKATEIGIDEITPLICVNSERKIIKEHRCQKILISAMKQSLKYHLPKLNKPISLTNFLETKFDGNKYIAHCQDGKKNTLEEIKKTKKTLFLIGPEGDFSSNEIKIALQNQFKAVSLGTSRLRTETAGIIATHTIHNK